MSIDYNALAIPKGKTVKQLKARKDREDEKQLREFRDAVWMRSLAGMEGREARCKGGSCRTGRCSHA